MEAEESPWDVIVTLDPAQQTATTLKQLEMTP